MDSVGLLEGASGAIFGVATRAHCSFREGKIIVSSQLLRM